MTRIHANNFITTLNGAISSGATSIIITSVTGFPTVGAGVTCNITIANGANIEILTVTARSSFTLTVTRGAESTVAKAFASGSTVSIRPTADSVDRKADLASPVFTGTVTIPTPFTLGAVSVLPTGTELNFVDGVTSNIQTQIDSKLTTSTLGTNVNTFLTTPSSANLAAALTDETGTGAAVFATSPTLVTPILGTITSGNLSAGTGSLVNLTTITTSADSTVNGCRIGRGSGNVSTSVAFGPNAMGTTAGTSANTVAIGSGALASITNINDNVAVGTNALTACVSGARNFGLGTAALAACTASDNVGVGYFVMTSNTSGDLNVGVGSNALQHNVTGKENTAVGYGTLQGVASNSCFRNTAIGRSTLNGITTGTDNTGIGWEAGVGVLAGAVGITSGTYNTLIGSSASSNSSTAVGILALGANSIADKHTGATSADHGAGLAIGSVAYPVAMRGDASAYAAVGASLGYMRVKLNGTYVKIQIYADA